jgi:hypothetical protein
MVFFDLVVNILLNEFKPDFLFWEGTFHLLPIFKKMSKISLKEIINYTKSNKLNLTTSIVFLKINLVMSKKRIIKDMKKNFIRFDNKQMNDLNKRIQIMNNNQNYLVKKIRNKIENIFFISSNKNIKFTCRYDNNNNNNKYDDNDDDDDTEKCRHYRYSQYTRIRVILPYLTHHFC